LVFFFSFLDSVSSSGSHVSVWMFGSGSERYRI